MRPIRAGQRRRFGGPSMRADAPDPPRARTHGKRAREESLIDDIGQQTIKYSPFPANPSVRRLIVTEKFNAAVRIATILSDGKAKRTNVEGTSVFEFSQGEDRVRVVGLRGHIINLDYPEALNDWARVDLKELVWAEPQKVVTAGKIGAALKQLAADADEVIIATDFDREGELIGVEALGLIQEVRPEVRVRRARFSALTKWDIESAFANLVEVDHPLAWSAESRQSVDLAWGAVLTRFLSIASKQLGRDYLSVGRVQSPTLALVVDREREIEDFVPQDYWTLHARFRKDADGAAAEFEANHEHGPFWAHPAAEARTLAAQERIVASRGRTQATDHPPIYPVQGVTREKVKRNDHWAIYELVVRRFFATVAPNAIAETAETKIDLGGQLFLAEGYRIKDPGWRKYYPYWTVREAILPALTTGESLDRVGPVTIREDRTKPPARYSEGSLIQEMERVGLGTKSTRHEIIKKLYDRKFIEGKYPSPTTSGRAVIEALEDHAERITEPEMTAHLEADMAAIATGTRSREDVVRESQQMLSEVLETLEANREAIGQEIEAALREQNYIGKCNVCKEGNLTVIRSRRGSRFLGCDRYPACRNTHPLPQIGIIQSAEENCPECGAPMIKHTHRGRTTSYCVASDCPSVREKNFIGRCEKCGDGEFMIRHGTYGKRFVGCSKYPACDNSYPLPQRGLIVPTEERCNACGHPVIKVIMRGRPPWVLCLNMKCPTKEGKGRKKGKGGPKKPTRRRKPKPVAVVADIATG